MMKRNWSNGKYASVFELFVMQIKSSLLLQLSVTILLSSIVCKLSLYFIQTEY